MLSDQIVSFIGLSMMLYFDDNKIKFKS